MPARYSKHHGLGNDFLIALTDRLPLDAGDRAIALCHRYTGIGADGLIYGIELPDGSVTMHLLNSDGSPAELSGNGLRCLAQAVGRSRGLPHLEVDVITPAGVRHCSVHATDDPDTVVATVEMGLVCPGPDPDALDLITAAGPSVAMVKRWETGDVGNPHIVCEVDDPELVDLLVAGPAIESHFDEGVNVHFARVSGLNEVTVRVWERGAGVTNACGTGATVVAHLFHQWDLVGEKVVVRMPGGDALVELDGALTLTGPATHIADFEVAHG
ncbi:MAG: diaminopimelate epimerase [Acidimicrobiales bacterium]